MRLKIGTRKSALALAQTELVRAAILAGFPEAEIETVPMGSPGDRAPERALAEFGGKGAFTQDLERALLSGEIDLAVHSAKDLPTELPEGLDFAAVLPREDPSDVLVTLSGIPAERLPAGSIIGTGSLRRALELKQINPQVKIRSVRGNVPTRLRKLQEGEYDGVILAAAGLRRLGLLPEAAADARKPGAVRLSGPQEAVLWAEILDPGQFLPAPGQGILCAEFRKGELSGVLAVIGDAESEAALLAERACLRVIGGGCNAPCAAWCRQEDGQLVMDVMYAADGRYAVRKHGSIAWKPLCMTGRKSAAAGSGDMLSIAAVQLAEKLARQACICPVALVGAGPGDAGLITGKGLARVRAAQALVYDDLISPSLVNEAPFEAELYYVGKRSGAHSMTQEQICALLIREAEAGKRVVRLKGGDPFVFGRGGEEAAALRAHGIPFEIVPGVTSACAVPACAGIPVTDRSCASSFHVITGREGEGKTAAAPDYETLAREKGTLVFLMGLSCLEKITAELMRFGKDPATPAAVISQGTTAGQKKVRAPLKDLAAAVRDQAIETPAVIVVGETAALGDSLEWFGNGPLAGVRVLATGTRRFCAKLEAKLVPLGAQTDSISLIESVRLGTGQPGTCGTAAGKAAREGAAADAAVRAVREAGIYTWLVFTSANGVACFFELLRELRTDLRGLSHLKFAAVGSQTAEELAAHGFSCDFVPVSGFSGEALAREWIPRLSASDRVLLLRARDGSPVLPEALAAAGISFTDVPLYENRTDLRRGGELLRLLDKEDYVVLASASAARAFAQLLTGAASADRPFPVSGAKIVAIGPYTAGAAKAAGIPVHVQAAEYTAGGIAAAILQSVRGQKNA